MSIFGSIVRDAVSPILEQRAKGGVNSPSMVEQKMQTPAPSKSQGAFQPQEQAMMPAGGGGFSGMPPQGAFEPELNGMMGGLRRALMRGAIR